MACVRSTGVGGKVMVGFGYATAVERADGRGCVGLSGMGEDAVVGAGSVVGGGNVGVV